ncbi:MAG TPA: hypothetical protein VN280_11450 [Variovorax sp.]|nr:hypothetical protein [Variovorax sp.]
MNRRVKWPFLAAAALGISGFAFVWYSATTSRDAELAHEYLMTEPAIRAKYKSINGLMLTGFRMANSRSYFTYWANTGDGRKFIKVVVDKNVDPWTVAELP